MRSDQHIEAPEADDELLAMMLVIFSLDAGEVLLST